MFKYYVYVQILCLCSNTVSMFKYYVYVRDKLNFAVLELREKGILAQWEKHWWIDKGECDPKKGSSKVSM